MCYIVSINLLNIIKKYLVSVFISICMIKNNNSRYFNWHRKSYLDQECNIHVRGSADLSENISVFLMLSRQKNLTSANIIINLRIVIFSRLSWKYISFLTGSQYITTEDERLQISECHINSGNNRFITILTDLRN